MYTTKKRKGRTTPNWNKKFLYQAVSVILPRGGNEWLQVIEMYQKLSGETNSREVNSARKQWHDVCCNKMQKPTGRAFSAGDGSDLVGQCQAVQLQIIEKTEGNMLGVNSVGDASTDDSSNDVEDSENDEEEELEANIMEANDNLDDLMEAGQATPVVLHDSPPQSEEWQTVNPVVGAPVVNPAADGARSTTAKRRQEVAKSKNSSNKRRSNIGKQISSMSEAHATSMSYQSSAIEQSTAQFRFETAQQRELEILREDRKDERLRQELADKAEEIRQERAMEPTNCEHWKSLVLCDN